MKPMKQTFLAVALAATTLPTLAQKAPEPAYTLSGNFAVTSDYRYRGISQSNLLPAVQGGVDFAHSSGLYLGNWNSSVSSYTAPNGSQAESDFYGGFKGELAGVGIDVGAIYYHYPGARDEGAYGKTTNYWDTGEAYIGVSYGPVSLKTSYTLTERYFSIGQSTSVDFLQTEDPTRTKADAEALADALGIEGSARGTLYVDLNLAHEVVKGVTLKAHAGHLKLAKSQGWNINDYSIGVAFDVDGWILGLTGYKTSIEDNAKDNFFEPQIDGKVIKLGKSGVVVSLSKSF